jgi:tetratricopeptide (TPR) repeat protein
MGLSLFAQSEADGHYWLKQLQEKKEGRHIPLEKWWTDWNAKGDDHYRQIIQQIKTAAGQKPDRATAALLDLLQAKYAVHFGGPQEIQKVESLTRRVLQYASEAEDEDLTAEANSVLSSFHFFNSQREEGLLHGLRYVAIAEKRGYEERWIQQMKLTLSSHLYQTHNYSTCISFGNSILKTTYLDASDVMLTHNNIGLAYRATGNYDSAIYHFEQAAALAQQIGNGVWAGIAWGNKGDVLRLAGKPQLAVPFWQQDIDSCLKYGEYRNAALTMVSLSETWFNSGKRKEAWSMMHRAAQQLSVQLSDRLHYYGVKARMHEAENQLDSSLVAWKIYYTLNDSVNALVSRSSFKQLKLTLDYESNTATYKTLVQQKKAEVIRRNLLLLLLGAGIITGLLLLNRQKLRYRLENGQRQLAEAEARSAQEQLQLFMETLVEKNEQIEKLSSSLHELQQERQEEALVQETILTEADWTRFKKLFEKAHPHFFHQLKTLAPDITPAEMRLAALIKLGLGNKEMAGMQGISLSSLRGNKSRLRQRLHPHITNDLESFIKEGLGQA